MLDNLTPLAYKAGETIFREGDRAGGIFLIQEGQVEISKMHDGEKLHLAKRHQGDIFGEMALVDNSPRSATVTASANTLCYVMDPSTFHKFLAEADPFLLNVFQAMSGTIREMNETLTMMANILEMRKK